MVLHKFLVSFLFATYGWNKYEMINKIKKKVPNNVVGVKKRTIPP